MKCFFPCQTLDYLIKAVQFLAQCADSKKTLVSLEVFAQLEDLASSLKCNYMYQSLQWERSLDYGYVRYSIIYAVTRWNNNRFLLDCSQFMRLFGYMVYGSCQIWMVKGNPCCLLVMCSSVGEPNMEESGSFPICAWAFTDSSNYLASFQTKGYGDGILSTQNPVMLSWTSGWGWLRHCLHSNSQFPKNRANTFRRSRAF